MAVHFCHLENFSLSISEIICGFHVPAEALRCTVYRAPQIPSGSNASEGPGGRRGWSSSRSWLAEEALLDASSEASDLKIVYKDGLCYRLGVDPV